jgi:hypothetical protein
MSLTGDLSDFGVAELLQILSMARRSGILEVEGDHAEGEIVLEGGKLIHAQAGEDSAGEDAFLLLVRNRAGRFSFTTGAGDQEVERRRVTITRNLDVLLLEASQRRG